MSDPNRSTVTRRHALKAGGTSMLAALVAVSAPPVTQAQPTYLTDWIDTHPETAAGLERIIRVMDGADDGACIGRFLHQFADLLEEGAEA